MKTQAQMFYDAERKYASLNELMLEMLYGPNPITDEELSALIRKRPEAYARFAGYIGWRS